MTEASYTGTYADQHGSERVVFRNDGATLTVVIRGVVFSGSDFDLLAPTAESQIEPGGFTLSGGDLCQCRFTVDIPVPVALPDSLTVGLLSAQIDLGAPARNEGIEHESLLLTLALGELRIVSSGRSGWFEDELLEIQAQLPAGAHLKACINCLYSDYSPYGHGLFGNMLCFRNIKNEYLQVTSKQEFWAVHGRQERQVQETYLCEQFVRRVPGTGYRG